MTPMRPFAAQSASGGDVVLWIVVLIAVVVAATAIILVVRRRLLAADEPSADGLTLHDLRRARDEGHLSEDEFEAARAAILGAVARDTGPRVGPLGEIRAAPGMDLAGRPLPPRRPKNDGDTDDPARDGR